MSSTEIRYNLVLLHKPNHQDIGDFLAIRNMMVGKAPEIEVTVVSLEESLPPVPTQVIPELEQRPTLFFSPWPVTLPPHIRGRLICSPRVSTNYGTKYGQFQILKDAGFPVPESCLVTGIDQLRNIHLEPLVVIKPNRGLLGRGVNLIRSSFLKDWTTEQFEQSPSNQDGMVVQNYIDIGSQPTSYRVMTVFGELIYCIKSVANSNIERLLVNMPNNGISIASNTEDRTIVEAYDLDVLQLGRSIHQKLDFTPVMGIDIVRDARTSELQVLELNPNGYVWHLSSGHGKAHQRMYSLNKYDQFNALKTITDSLIEVTRRQAI